MQLLRKIIWPFSLLYAAGIYLRNLLYDLGLKTSTEFKTPTICVGNLSTGGTGKTPMIEWIIQNIPSETKIAVLSRGYRRKSSGFILADKSSTALDIGDEPLQIYSKFPNVIMAVDANRRRGISILERDSKPELILLDDAFQHRRVKARFSLLLTSFDSLYSADFYLPTGDLRDLKSQAKRADMIVVTKSPPDLDQGRMNDIRTKLKPEPHQKVLFSTLAYAETINGGLGEQRLEELEDRPITVVTGIANPEPLIKHLKEYNIQVNHIRYKDHHQFKPKEIQLLSLNDLILTTEKDYARGLKELKQAAYLEVRHQFLGNGRQILLNALNSLKR